jgi:hypothetical protein
MSRRARLRKRKKRRKVRNLRGFRMSDDKCEICGNEFVKVHEDHLCSTKCRKIKNEREKA